MTKLFHTLASIKLAIILLVLLLVGLAAGTIIESRFGGAAVAGRVVYYSWWFIALQAVFALNVLAAIVERFPWGSARIGFLMLHGSMVLILGGAVTSYFFKSEGRLSLWEGQMSNEVVSVDGEGRGVDRIILPFSVRLIDFRIDHYQGTMRPANFRSDVQIIDAKGQASQAAIYMNNPYSKDGWTLFQSSYQQSGGREATVLSVSKDPGQDVVFLGYILLTVGMLVVLATRISQAKAASRNAEAARSVAKRGLGVVAAAALLAVGGVAYADVDAVARLPVQHDGRVMAFDTLAREAVRQVTGNRTWNGEEPVETVTRWTSNPKAAAQERVVKIGSPEIAFAAGLSRGDSYASFDQLVGSKAVLDLMDRAREAASREQARAGVLGDAEKLEQRLEWMQRFLQREVIRAIPPPAGASPTARWNVAPMYDAQGLAALASGARPQGWPDASDMDREITYNRTNPWRIAWIVLALALVASIVEMRRPSKVLHGISLAGLAVGFGFITWGIAMRWMIGDRVPAANMYESLLFLSWGVGLFAVIAFAFIRNRIVVMNANAMAALTMLLVDLLPMDGFIHPVPPVLAGTPWLAIHVPIIMVSYSVLALGVLVAHLQIGFTIFSPKNESAVAKMADLNYWYMHIGSILLIVGIMTGSIWAASSWGRYWGWDPKEVWSLVAFLAYMAIIHARWEKMIGPFTIAALSIIAFQTILMTYLGVNYVLGTGLHSYGFGDSPVLMWMMIVAAVEIAFLAWGVVAYRKQPRTSPQLAY